MAFQGQCSDDYHKQFLLQASLCPDPCTATEREKKAKPQSTQCGGTFEKKTTDEHQLIRTAVHGRKLP